MSAHVKNGARSDIPLLICCGFGTAVGMWWTGYVTHLPLIRGALPAPVVFVFIGIWMIAGGYFCGRRALSPLRAGLGSGLVAGVVNLMVFGSLISDGDEAGGGGFGLRVALFVAFSSAIGALGAFLARTTSSPRHSLDAVAGLGVVAAAATALVLVTGGLVTTYEAGMAVEDWPTSYGSNMFLYPLSKMVGGIYFEHAHRLFGSLVGVTVLTLGLLILKTEGQFRRLGELLFLFVAGCGASYLVGRLVAGESSRPEIWFGAALVFTTVIWGLRWWLDAAKSSSPGGGGAPLASGALLVFLIMCLQGMLGGMRVLEDNLHLAALHGVTGQIAFVAVVALTITSAKVFRASAPDAPITNSGDRRSLNVLMAALLGQLVLGAMLRHFGDGWLMLHIAGGVAVFLLAAHSAIRLIGLHGEVPLLRRGGRALLVTVLVQFALGFGAFGVLGVDMQEEPDTALEVLVPTAHQASGALLLATALFCLLWVRRLGPRPGLPDAADSAAV